MDQKQMVATTFDTVASTYDDVGVDFFGPIADGLVSGLDLCAGERLLDVGCGKGAVLTRAAAAVGASGRVVGVDIAPRMVQAAREATAGLPVEVRVGDAEDPGLDGLSFDVVTSSLVLFFLPDPVRALRAWRGLLVDGGRVGVSTFGDYTSDFRAVDEVFLPYLPPQLRDARTSGAAGPFASDAGVEGLLRDAGFTEVRTSSTEIQVRFADEEQRRQFSMSTGQRAFWETVPPDKRDEVRDEAYRRLRACRDSEGRLGFDQVARFTYGRRSGV